MTSEQFMDLLYEFINWLIDEGKIEIKGNEEIQKKEAEISVKIIEILKKELPASEADKLLCEYNDVKSDGLMNIEMTYSRIALQMGFHLANILQK